MQNLDYVLKFVTIPEPSCRFCVKARDPRFDFESMARDLINIVWPEVDQVERPLKARNQIEALPALTVVADLKRSEL